MTIKSPEVINESAFYKKTTLHIYNKFDLYLDRFAIYITIHTLEGM